MASEYFQRGRRHDQGASIHYEPGEISAQCREALRQSLLLEIFYIMFNFAHGTSSQKLKSHRFCLPHNGSRLILRKRQALT